MPESVCIVGLGLMGGSLALAWQKAQVPWRVCGVDRDAATIAAALRSGAIADGSTEVGAGVAKADAIVLAVPVRGILALLPQVGRLAKSGTLVMDLGSTKVDICKAMEQLPERLQPVGGHPMCGTEQAGFAGAHAELYRERAFVLCPLKRTSAAALDTAQQLATAAGGRPLISSPDKHDAAVAAISHLPYVAAVAVTEAIARQGSALAWQLAASGFRDTTRVAAGSAEVMLDALLTNRAAVLNCIDSLQEEVARLKIALLLADEAGLRAYLASAQGHRSGWQSGTRSSGN